jgi:hypothetical protein
MNPQCINFNFRLITAFTIQSAESIKLEARIKMIRGPTAGCENWLSGHWAPQMVFDIADRCWAAGLVGYLTMRRVQSQTLISWQYMDIWGEPTCSSWRERILKQPKKNDIKDINKNLLSINLSGHPSFSSKFPWVYAPHQNNHQ